MGKSGKQFKKLTLDRRNKRSKKRNDSGRDDRRQDRRRRAA